MTAVAFAMFGWASAFWWIIVRVGRMANRLAQVLSYPATNHDPECKVYFQRDPHRASPHFWFGLERPTQTNSFINRFRPIEGCAVHARAFMEGKKSYRWPELFRSAAHFAHHRVNYGTSSSARIGTTSRSHGVTFPELAPIANCGLHPESNRSARGGMPSDMTQPWSALRGDHQPEARTPLVPIDHSLFGRSKQANKRIEMLFHFNELTHPWFLGLFSGEGDEFRSPFSSTRT